MDSIPHGFCRCGCGNFEAVLRRHGLWNYSVEDFVKAGAEQLEFAGVSKG